MQRECGETLKQIINGFRECKNAFTAIAGETRWKEITSFMGNKNMYFILTCEGSIGNAGKYLAKLCKRKNMHYCGCMGITMPENYIALLIEYGKHSQGLTRYTCKKEM